MIASTRAIVLNTHKYGDTSLICNLFSKDYGKLNIISKGACTLKNPNSAILQPMNYIEICYYYKSKRNIQFLKEASINNHFSCNHQFPLTHVFRKFEHLAQTRLVQTHSYLVAHEYCNRS